MSDELIEFTDEELLLFRKEETLRETDRAHSRILNMLTGGASIEERDTWQPKALAAQGLLDGTATAQQVSMIETEASMLGLTTEQLAGIIVAKSNAYFSIIGVASGIRTKTRAGIKAATSIDEVNAIVLESQNAAREAIGQIMAARAAQS